jgi:ribosomal protein S18 acetylase RimI-like enzyme
MQNLFKIITVDLSNLSEHPQAICFMNPKNPDYKIKVGWLQKRFKEGLVIKLLYPSEGKRAVGFIEYTPGEYAWRSVSAAGYMFINCIWVFSNDNKNKGLGSILINECADEADKKGYLGTAVVASEGSFMAGKDLFIKNGFRIADERKPSYTLLVKSKKRIHCRNLIII